MTTRNPRYAALYAEYQNAARAAVKFTHPDFTNSAITRTRVAQLTAARQTLVSAHAEAAGGAATLDPTAARAEALGQLSTNDANSVAVTTNEWAKVQTLLDNGRNLAQMIDNADQRRLAAILDRMDDLTLKTGSPEAVEAEISGRVLARLAALGDAKAVEAIEIQQAADYESAWAEVIDQTSRGAVSVTARSALYSANVDDYNAAFEGEADDTDLAQAIGHLDRVAPSIALEGASRGDS